MKRQVLTIMVLVFLCALSVLAFAAEGDRRFVLDNKDITSWEAGPKGKWLYIYMTDEKAAELTNITKSETSGPVGLVINNQIMRNADIPKPLNGKNGMAIGGAPEMISGLKSTFDAATEIKLPEKSPKSAEMGVGTKGDKAPE